MAYTKTGSVSFTNWYNLKDGEEYDKNHYLCQIDEYNGNGGVYGVVVNTGTQILGDWVKKDMVTTIKTTDGQFHALVNSQGHLGQTTTNSLTISGIFGYTQNFIYEKETGNIVSFQHRVDNLQIPLFREDDKESIQKYIKTGDDSGAINYDDLHGFKCDIYCTNNGDRITFTTKPQEGDVPQYDRIILTYTVNLNSYTVNLPITNSSFTMKWGSWGLPISKISCSISIYNNTSVKAKFDFELTKKLLIFGKNSVEPNYIEDNGYHFNGATDNSFDDIEEEAIEDSDATSNDSDGSVIGGFNNLTQTYQVSKVGMDDLGSFIWNNSIFDNIKNINNSPLENIVSCHYMPCSIGGTNSPIKLGNITTNVSGDKVSQTVKRKRVATFTIPKPNTGFMNYEPFTEVTLYLPLVGMVQLSAKDVCGYTVTIDYVFDVVVGTFGVMVYTSKGGGKTLIYSSQGTCSIDIPLTASNRSQIQAGFLTAGVSLVSSTMAKDVTGIVSTGIDVLTQPVHSTTFGSPSSMIGVMSPTTCYYVLRTCKPYIPTQFAHTHGFICMATYQLKNLKGFTKLSPSVDLSGFAITSSELDELKSILTSGFYL